MHKSHRPSLPILVEVKKVLKFLKIQEGAYAPSHFYLAPPLVSSRRHLARNCDARIYFHDGEVGLSSVGSAIYGAGVHALLRPGEVGLPAMSGVGPQCHV